MRPHPRICVCTAGSFLTLHLVLSHCSPHYPRHVLQLAHHMVVSWVTFDADTKAAEVCPQILFLEDYVAEVLPGFHPNFHGVVETFVASMANRCASICTGSGVKVRGSLGYPAGLKLRGHVPVSALEGNGRLEDCQL